MTGHYDKNGIMEVKKIVMPTAKISDGMTPDIKVQSYSVTKENIELALTYAEKCAQQMLSWQTLTPADNLYTAKQELKRQSSAPAQKPDIK